MTVPSSPSPARAPSPGEPTDGPDSGAEDGPRGPGPGAAEPIPAPGFSRKRLAFVTAIVIAATDLWSKAAVFASLDARSIAVEPVLGDWLSITRVWNEGMMWGALQDYGDILRLLRVVAVFVVLAMIRSTPRRDALVQFALGLVLGGALGNIYDGFVHGAVRDFVMVDFDVRPFDPFPVFNVADSGICVGVALLAISMFGSSRSGR